MPGVNAASAPLWPLLVYLIAVLVVVGGMLVISYLLGQRHNARAIGEPYESGMPVTGSARLRLDVKYYLVAMLFVIFDLETVFLVAWTIAFRGLGWAGYVEMLVFVGVLVATLTYLIREGAFDWGSSRRFASGADLPSGRVPNREGTTGGGGE